MLPQLFFQNTDDPFVVPLKQAQNIQPVWLHCLSIIQVGSNSSSLWTLTHILQCIPSLIQVSSVHNTVNHCSEVQLRCSWAKASRIAHYWVRTGSSRRAIRLWNPARLKADVIDHSDAPLHVHIGYSRGNCAQGRRQLWREAQTKVASSWSWSSSIKRGRPERFLYTQLGYWDAKTLEMNTWM